MPRLQPRILHRAHKVDPLLPLVLQGTRDLASAKNELRWLREFTIEQQQKQHDLKDWNTQQKLRQFCIERARGKPLQYIMGTEYFGDLEIACEPGVLIPRQETAASVTHLINRLHQGTKPLPRHLKILDLCTGTGCIPLLAYHEFTTKHGRNPNNLEILGVDVSRQALRLANKNLHRLASEGTLPPNPSLRFLQADVLAVSDSKTSTESPSLTSVLQTNSISSHPHWDILISNPPYISPTAFSTTTTRSVKRYEPLLALVPSAPATLPPSIDDGDTFYPHLLSIAAKVSARVILFEVADLEQAQRIAEMARQQGIWDRIEIWRDDPGEDGEASVDMGAVDERIRVLGRGNGRSVVAYRGDAVGWLGAK
ncbi:S-adenosyl-L-methionine-dependent methyltransferase [Aureobasidium sp. EXF-10728]|nr:S-adenosyl-L-methionine-dependent methyltransferase [Aureobasidium sp. EXF-10728]